MSHTPKLSLLRDLVLKFWRCRINTQHRCRNLLKPPETVFQLLSQQMNLANWFNWIFYFFIFFCGCFDSVFSNSIKGSEGFFFILQRLQITTAKYCEGKRTQWHKRPLKQRIPASTKKETSIFHSWFHFLTHFFFILLSFSSAVPKFLLNLGKQHSIAATTPYIITARTKKLPPKKH